MTTGTNAGHFVQNPRHAHWCIAFVALVLLAISSACFAAQVNVVFKAGSCLAERDRILLGAGGARVNRVDALRVVTASLPDAEAWRALQKRSEVALVEEDAVALASDESQAEGRATRSSSSAVGAGIATGVDRIDAEPALSANTGAGVLVAVLDTGIDLLHPDLTGALLRDSRGNVVGCAAISGLASVQDDNGHGTHVAGTIAAKYTAGGVVGVAPGVKLMPVKVLDHTGSGSYSSITAGIVWAADHGAKVLNMSLGGTAASNTLQAAVTYAANRGVQIVCAAGNNGAEKVAGASTVGYPARYAQCIAVGAWLDTDGKPGGLGPQINWGFDDTLAPFSATGPEVDIVAPGVAIRSTWPGGGYNVMSGTSMATPHVTGVMARILAASAVSPRTVLTTRYTEALPGYTAAQVGAGLVRARSMAAKALIYRRGW
jgi:subtilisin family serine protease